MRVDGGEGGLGVGRQIGSTGPQPYGRPERRSPQQLRVKAFREGDDRAVVAVVVVGGGGGGEGGSDGEET